MFAVTIVLAAGVAAVFGATPRADAHPLGNFTVNRYTRIELYRDSIQLHYVLDFAEIPTFQLMETIDGNHDGIASDDELTTYRAGLAKSVLANIDLRIADERLSPQLRSGTAQVLPGQGGLGVLRVEILYATPVTAQEGHRAIQFTDRNYDDRVGWKEIVVRPSEGAATVVTPALMIDTSDALRSYPETATSTPDARAVAFEWTPGTGTATPVTAPVNEMVTPRSDDQFSALLSRPRSMTVIVASLFAAFWFGALHALGPGHGKTVVAAYLVGSKGTVRHALALGFTVTATHTAMVYLLGFVTIAASAFIVPERLYLYLGVASGLSVLAMGVTLFASRLARLRRGTEPAGVHRHGWGGRSHDHTPPPALVELEREQEAYALQHGWGPRPSAADHTHASGTHTHDHSTPTGAASERVTWRSIMALGVAGGLLPCPSALLVMLAAISLGQVMYGMLLIVAFSAGLAGVLTVIGIALVLGKRLSRYPGLLRSMQRPALTRIVSVLPAASALGIAVAGLLITLQAGRQFGI